MEAKRIGLIALRLVGKTQAVIIRELSCLKASKIIVYRTILRYNDTGGIAKRGGRGPKRTAASTAMVRKVRVRLERNPRPSDKQRAEGLKISACSLRCILKNEHEVKPYKLQKAPFLTEQQKKVRLERAKELLRLHDSGQIPDFVFSDEKNFPTE